MLRFDGTGGFRMRLVSMGLNVGSVVEVIQGGRGGRGPTLIASGHTRLAIGHGMAQRIIVAAEEPGSSRERARVRGRERFAEG